MESTTAPILTPVLTPVSTRLADVVVGQKIWATIIVPVDNLNITGKMSTDKKKIATGKPVRKQLVILKNEKTHLIGAYLSTFGQSNVLTDEVKDPASWYPVEPATGAYAALPSVDGQPAWVCLTATFKITDDPVPVLSAAKYSEDSVKLIIAQLEANNVTV